MAALLPLELPSRAPERQQIPRAAPSDRRPPGQTSRATTDRSETRKERIWLGVAALVVSTILFPLSDTFAKTLATHYSGLQIAWFRYAVLLVASLPIVARRPTVLWTTRPVLHAARGIALCTATVLAVTSFVYLPVADATAIAFCAPLIITGLAALILKEHVGIVRWTATAIGFAGIVIIVQPGGDGFRLPAALPLLSSLFSALTVILTRLGRNERIETTLIASAAIGFVLLSVPMIWMWKTPDLAGLLIGLAMGCLAAAATILQLLAYRCASASVLAPFSYVQIIFAVLIGWFLTGAVPSAIMLAGSAVVIASGAASGWRGSKRPVRRRLNWIQLRRDLLRLQPSSRQAA